MRAIGFFRDVLRLNGGEFEGLPYILLDWQMFIVGSLFGWLLAVDETRRFRTAYIETSKGSGKSPLAAGIGLYGMMADGEAGAEIYAAATKKDQAMILFRDAVAMVDQSPHLSSRIVKSGTGLNVWNLAWLDKRSFFKPIASDDGQSGPRPHVSLVDEFHEHKDGYVIEMLKAGQKFRRQPLLVAITNSGTNKLSACWDYHEYGAKVCSGQMADDSFFAYICALDEGEDPFKSEACWPKTNPSLRPQGKVIHKGREIVLGGLPGMRYLREQVDQARGMPSKESLVRRLNFCQWVGAESPWVGPEKWFACQDDGFEMSRLAGRRCYGGLDLSSTQDLTSLVLEFEPTEDDPVWREVSYFWLPGANLQAKEDQDRVPYTLWQKQGFLETTDSVGINKLAVAIRAAEITAAYDLQALAYDRWRMADFMVLLEQEGISLPLVPFGQGFKDMAPAVDEYELRLINQRMRHMGNPVATMCMANAVVAKDPSGNRKLAKDKATGRIDGAVAAVMATGASLMAQESMPIIGADYELLIV